MSYMYILLLFPLIMGFFLSLKEKKYDKKWLIHYCKENTEFYE